MSNPDTIESLRAYLMAQAKEQRSLATQWATAGRKSPHNIEAAEHFEAWCTKVAELEKDRSRMDWIEEEAKKRCYWNDPRASADAALARTSEEGK